MERKTIRPVHLVLVLYLVCLLLRLLEYFLLRTDQGVIGEAFLHKLLGIVVVVAVCRRLQYRPAEIGFCTKDAGRQSLYGLLLGAAVFGVAYGLELLLLRANGQAPQLQFFVSSYGVEGNRVLQGSLFYVLVCVIGNLINVLMEEGLFRGLLLRLLEGKQGFWKACLFSSLLFGLWHIVSPLRNWLDGEQSLAGAGMAALLLVVTSMLMGIQLCLLLKITGSLWASMGAHFVNNTVVNLLHVVTAGGPDLMQTMRISIAQTLSFVLVLLLFWLYKARGRETFRC